MKQVFVLMGQEDAWESSAFCVGVFSTRDKAEAVLPKAEATFPYHTFWIEPTDVDVFDWR